MSFRLVIAPRMIDGLAVPNLAVGLDVEAPAPGACLVAVAVGNDWAFDVPDATQRLTLRVIGKPGLFFDVEATLAVSAGGVAPFGSNPEVGPITPVPGAGTRTLRVPVVLPRVRDVTDRAAAVLGRPWDLPSRSRLFLTNPLPPSGLGFVSQSVKPGPSRVFEVAHLAVPKLVSVTWPSQGWSGQNRFVVYFHHRIAQNTGKKFGFLYTRNHQNYPWGADYLEFVFMHYLDFVGSPLDGLNGGKGLAYQLAASGRDVALVIPLPTIKDNAGSFLEAAKMESVLLELAAKRQRSAGQFTLPVIDRVAISSFSSGDVDALEFLSGKHNRSHPFARDVVREAYRFEGIDDSRWGHAATAWASHGSDKRIRVYRQNKISHHGLHDWPAQANRTFALLPPAKWKAVGATADPWWNTESLIANTMFLDALRRSGF